jgi:hypothetical protein
MRTFALVAVAALLAGCSTPGATHATGPPGPTPSPAAAEHESGPQSPIAFGFYVPSGATQLGPLARFRSDRLIAAYEPDLHRALVAAAVNDARRDASANPDGVADPTPPTPPPVAQAGDDTFGLLERPPSPDITYSFMRVDKSPTNVVRRMTTEIAAALPSARVKPDDFGSYCTVKRKVLRGCSLAVRGTTKEGTPIAVALNVDLGNGRLAPAGSADRPIMILKVSYLGNPRERPKEPGDIDVDKRLKPLSDPPRWGLGTSEAPLGPGFALPTNATLLLSGDAPMFASAVVRRGRDADLLARQFAARGSATIDKDVVEELNEVRTTYTSTGRDGTAYFGSFVLSARGNYVILLRLPRTD